MSREAYSDIAHGLIIKELSSQFLKILADSASENKYKTATQTTSVLIHKLSVVEKFFWYVI